MCDSIMLNDNGMSADKTIKLSPAGWVLKYQVGDVIKLDEAQFRLIFETFFAEIERTYL